MQYASVEDVEKGFRKLAEEEREKANSLLEEASCLIDTISSNAKEPIKKIVACRMVRRGIGNNDQPQTFPIGSTQGAIGALGYTQSWSLSNGSVGELYISKQEKQLLGVGNKIGSKSPLEVSND
jgi:hypothetical protein|nr:MAG TPA: hypothetical protein [Caudoviricetes sp.]